MNERIVDTDVPEPKLFEPEGSPGFFTRVRKLRADRFGAMYIAKVFERGGFILDIGGGLRIDQRRGNKFNAKNLAAFGHFLTQPHVRYTISDYTDKYKPDMVEDIHALSLPDNAVDGLFCLAVIEHVYDPKKAAEEIVRVLKKDGRAFIYVPFLYRYHAHQTDYRDYYRFTKDGIAYLFRGCKTVLLCPVCGLFESMVKLTPLRAWRFAILVARMLDESTPRLRALSKVQTGGYHIYIEK